MRRHSYTAVNGESNPLVITFGPYFRDRWLAMNRFAPSLPAFQEIDGIDQWREKKKRIEKEEGIEDPKWHRRKRRCQDRRATISCCWCHYERGRRVS